MTESSNFDFMDRYDHRVGRLAHQAEEYVYADPESCLFKLRLMIETMAKTLIELQAPHLIDSDLSTMLQALERSRLLSRSQADQMHAIRRDGNSAVHGDRTPAPTAMRRLHDAHRLSGWYCKAVSRGAKFNRVEFHPPERPHHPDGHETWARGEVLEQSIEAQRRRTREALLLFGEDEDADLIGGRLIAELKALDDIAVAAGEPLLDAEFVALVMAMDIEKLLEHPRFGVASADAHAQAEARFQAVRSELEAKEQAYRADRRKLAEGG